MFNYCVNRGEFNTDMSRRKLGPQRCECCGAVICVTRTSKTFAYVPKHKTLERK